MPFSVHDNVDHPLSLYAATKKANELMAHAYAHLYALPVTGLRFFTVYGPWGRPDMSPFLFTEQDHRRRADRRVQSRRARSATSPISTTSSRAWCARSIVCRKPDPDWSGDKPDPATSSAPYRLYNIGNHTPVG